MNPQDSRGHGGKPGLIEMGYSKDTGSTGSLARQRRPVRGPSCIRSVNLEKCGLGFFT
jgi:hypothetical protein